MNKESRSNTVLLVALVAAGCLVLLCLAIAIFFFFFGFSTPLTLEEQPVETTSLSEAQLEQCREVMAIRPEVELEGEYYLYTPGFLDDSLECHLQVQADGLAEVFDLSVIDPSLTTNQEVAPGRFVRLKIEKIEPGRYHIEGLWFQT
ncbi:MAG: hypothetical protein H6654_02955 [Ardenticatenaceae bacterium]|nr:hypothetical protein [Anaerolineales bacterium]MCB8941148.1 hypothetical protein [Ardenticatenaceae bacterium]MCB8972489.1 hypothetical protein [Ardenticatenaceae bacterium]